ncbi:DUF1758 domain-containing protein [Trichonephila clavipes]|nr:DUF1758 domain-containing protein [Trichonephila clavipes]
MAPKELSELTVFNRRKAHLLGQITRIRNSLENVESPLNQVEKRAKLASLSEVKAKIDKLRTESYGVLSLSDEELMDFEASLDTMEVDTDNLEVSLNTLLESSNVNTPELSVKNDFANYNVKLPSINLPEFSGQYIDWLQFKSQFVSLIHDNTSLSDSQKLYYLQSALKGHAKQLQTVNDSYSSLFEALEGHRLIKNCLKLNRKCRVCNANHNSLLCKTSVPRAISEPHQNRNIPSPQSSSGVIYDPSPATTVINPQTATCLYNGSGEKSILLSTAKVKVQSATGGWLVMNAILDSGSQKCLCSLEASNFLGLEKYSMNSTIVGLNGACISVRKRISAEISNGSSFKRKLNFLIVPKITGCVPTQPLDLTKIKLPPNITYADAEFNIPKRIDILLGEAIGIKAESSCDPDDQAMQHFKSSVRFNSGRYEVGFPWKSHTQELNDNFSVAEKRVKSLTRRFIRDPTLYIQYSEILKEYESQGIIERVLETEKPTDRAVFYLPHQAVFRQESLTTKMRIVFDASSHEDGQPSLNDCIWSGGNLNPNIFHLIISFA